MLVKILEVGEFELTEDTVSTCVIVCRGEIEWIEEYVISAV